MYIERWNPSRLLTSTFAIATDIYPGRILCCRFVPFIFLKMYQLVTGPPRWLDIHVMDMFSMTTRRSVSLCFLFNVSPSVVVFCVYKNTMDTSSSVSLSKPNAFPAIYFRQDIHYVSANYCLQYLLCPGGEDRTTTTTTTGSLFSSGVLRRRRRLYLTPPPFESFFPLPFFPVSASVLTDVVKMRERVGPDYIARHARSYVYSIRGREEIYIQISLLRVVQQHRSSLRLLPSLHNTLFFISISEK